MRNIIASLLFSIFITSSFTSFAQHKKGSVHVFITAGQSNTDGRVSNKLLPAYIKALATDTIEYNKGQYRFCKIAQNRTDGHFVPYWPKGRITDGLWTYDAVTYYQLEQRLQEEFYVIKWAVGGTSIGYPDTAGRGRYWSANPDWLKNTTSTDKKGRSLLLSLTEAIDAGIDQTLSKIDRGYRIDAFFWHQGESDDRYAGKYYENLKAVISYVRNHLTNKTGKDYSSLPFIFGSIPASNRHYKAGVEAAMQRIAKEDSNAHLVDMSKGSLQKDRTHFDAASAEYLGQEMYKVVEKTSGLSGLSGHPDINIRIARYRDDKPCAISYTFDDGLKEHYTLVAPKFRALGFKGTFWINGSKINENEKAIKDTTRMSWRNLKEMSEYGHEISNHGWAHKNFGRHTLDQIKEDIFKNDSAIYLNVGIMPRTFCYPNNTKTPEGVRIASENRIGTRTEQRSVGGKSTSENLENWIKTLRLSGDWGVTMTHGITYGYDHFKSADIFWEHLQKVKAMENEIWIGTFREVAAYVRMRDSTSMQVTKKDDSHYTISPECLLDRTLFTESLTAVINQRGVKKVKISQGKKKLKAEIEPDKVLFAFDPYAGPIEVEIRKKKG